MPVEDEWTMHRTSGFTFFTGEGITLLGSFDGNIDKAQAHFAQAKQKKPDVIRWRWERATNHVHQSMGLPSRELAFHEWGYAVELSDALAHAFPHRTFIVTWIPQYAVSFYGWEEGATGPGVTVLHEPDNTIRCVTCEAQRAYTWTANPDPDIPELRWAWCSVCHTDLLPGDYEVCQAVGPGLPGWRSQPTYSLVPRTD